VLAWGETVRGNGKPPDGNMMGFSSVGSNFLLERIDIEEDEDR